MSQLQAVGSRLLADMFPADLRRRPWCVTQKKARVQVGPRPPRTAVELAATSGAVLIVGQMQEFV